MIQIFLAFASLFFLSWGSVSGQIKLSKKGQFLFPIKPGKSNSLTGNMGELRSNHFHGGLDIRTGWASGLPVYCAKDGYISKVSMAGDGYGNTIFVTHPDGFVTLYAHLDRLAKPLLDYVKKKQYELRSFEIDVVIPKNLFKVKQGDTIAISGNTGSSRGPHLHFEIRDTNNLVFNPLSFGFEEIQDKHTPVFERLAIVPLDIHSRIDGKFERQEILLRAVGNDFIAVNSPKISGTVGLEMKAFDRITNGTSHGGIFCTEMLQDGKLVYFHNMNQFPFEKSNHVNHLMNYRVYRVTGEKFQKLYSPDGYFQQAFLQKNHQGRIQVRAGAESKFEIWLFDEKGNKRRCHVTLKGEPTRPPVVEKGPRPTRLNYDILDNTLIIKANGQSDSSAFLFFKGKKVEISPALAEGNRMTYLHDLRHFLPDSFQLGASLKQYFSFKATVVPRHAATIKWGDFQVQIPERTLFDTLFLDMDADEKGVLRINASDIPMAGWYQVQTKDPCENGKKRAYAEAINGVFNKPLRSFCEGGQIQYQTKYLGKSMILKDSIPPIIKAGPCNSMGARFNIYDNLSGIDKIEATINGSWVLMVWDKKQHLIYTEPWPQQLPMKGEFKLRVSDKAGNVKEFVKNL